MDATSIITGLGYFFGAVILIAGKGLFDLVFKYLQNNGKGKMFRNSIKTTEKINAELATIRDKHGFNRVSLIDYHNGIENFRGLSFKNASMRYEVVDPKTSRIISDFQNVPCSIVAEMLVELEDSDKGYVMVTDEGDTQTTITHKMYSVHQAYNFKLGKTLVDGVVSCMFTDQMRNLTEEEILDIKASLQKIYLLRLKK